MKLRTLIILSIAVMLLIGLSSYAVGYHLKHRYDPVALAEVKSQDSDGAKCAAANKSIRLTSGAQQSIATAAVRHVKDLPANTQASVVVASYDNGKSASGHVEYNNKMAPTTSRLTKRIAIGKLPPLKLARVK